MLIKAADDKQPQLDALAALLERPDVDAATRKRIELELKLMRSGIRGEREAAYDIDFAYRDAKRHAVIHDLRIELDGRVAQIDHLILNHMFDLWVCESKAFSEGVQINEHGEWLRYAGGRAYGMPSPVEQNRRHIAVLDAVFSRGLVDLPKRLGVTLKPTILSVILVSNSARISRPKRQVDGIDTVIKSERLEKTLETRFDKRSTVGIVAKLVSAETVERVARGLAALHRPASFDWAARFGLSPAVAAAVPTKAAETSLPDPGVAQCANCGKAVSERVVAYCRANSRRFGGTTVCYDCQRGRTSTPSPPRLT